MNTLKVICTTLAVLLATSSVRAEVAPVMIRLSFGVIGQGAYTVPAGKVLIINHVRISGTGLADPTIRIGMEVLNAPVFSDVTIQIADGPVDSDRLYPVSPPIRLKGGSARLTIPPAMSSGTQIFLGMLIDATDLYAAAIPLELQNPRQSDGRLLADAKMASPRPRVVKVESSDDLSSFDTDDTSRVTETVDPKEAVVSVDADGERKFLRTRAIARSGAE